MNRLTILVVAGLLSAPVAGWAITNQTQSCSPQPYGTLLGSNNGVAARSDNNPPNPRPTRPACNGGSEDNYECVEYVRDWGSAVMGFCLQAKSYAYQFWGETTTHDGQAMHDYDNGSSTPPQFGDLLVYKSSLAGSGGAGHIAAIVAVNTSTGYVRVAEQNFENCTWPGDYSRQLPMSTSGGYTISGSDIYGWIRVGSASTYIAHYLGQSESVTPWLAPNASRMMWVDYRNEGTGTWTTNVELRSLTGSDPCVLTNGCAYDPADWITQQRITVANQASVLTGSTARFQFQAKAPSTTGNCVQWVAPWAPGGTCMQGWGGVNFTIRTDATPPNAFSAYVSPTTNNTNSFAFSWDATTDDHSGLYQYYWSVNGGAETPTTSTSVSAGAWATIQGTNTLTVRAVDNVGNSRSASATFTLTSSPCPGREIPHNPCVGSSTCYPASAADLLQLPTLTPEEWQKVGQRVQGLLVPGQTYSLGFEYRSPAARGLKLGLGSFNAPITNLGVMIGRSALPPATEDWKTFWSSPFTLTADDLRRFPNLRLGQDGEAGSMQIRNVRVLRTPLAVTSK